MTNLDEAGLRERAQRVLDNTSVRAMPSLARNGNTLTQLIADARAVATAYLATQAGELEPVASDPPRDGRVILLRTNIVDAIAARWGKSALDSDDEGWVNGKGFWVLEEGEEVTGWSELTASPPPSVAEVEAAARALVAKLEAIHEDPAYESVWTVNQLHVGPYTGPTYIDELNALRAALRSKP